MARIIKKAHESVFGNDFKYVLALTALAWMVYTMPAVQAAIVG
jgi:hypothetical protein